MSWYTKEDVIGDLAEVMGGRIKHDDLDEQFILIGEQPPPPCRSGEEDDEELLSQLFGGVSEKITDGVCKAPDLAGITEMLRMVDKHEFSDGDEHNNNILQENGTTVISISKLNPTASSFMPQNGVSNKNKECEKVKESSVEENNENSKIVISDSKKKDPATVKEISEKLKSRISSPSHSDCLKKKRDRNLAIATLLKLYSDAPEKSVTSGSPPKLIKPEYFEKSYINLLLPNKPAQNCHKMSTKSLSSTSSAATKNIDIAIIETQIDNSVNQEVKESVEKVNNWLNKGEEPKSMEPALYLGPVTFKRKEKAIPKPEKSDRTEKNHKPLSTPFVPSAYANKLSQSFMERSKANNQEPDAVPKPLKSQMTIWSKIEKEIKAKDEEIVRRKREEATQNSQSNNSVQTNSDECS